MIRVVLADDHKLVRAGIRELLNACEDIEVVSEIGTGREAVSACRDMQPDVILLDLNMPDMDGLDATKQITAGSPDVKIIVLTMSENTDLAVRVLRSGASGFLVKGIDPEELPDAIREVYGGNIHITPSMMQEIALRQAKKHSKNTGDVTADLSDRELQVLMCFTRGLSSNHTAEELGLSASTVATYKARIMEKLNVNNSAELMRLCLLTGLISKFE